MYTITYKIKSNLNIMINKRIIKKEINYSKDKIKAFELEEAKKNIREITNLERVKEEDKIIYIHVKTYIYIIDNQCRTQSNI